MCGWKQNWIKLPVAKNRSIYLPPWAVVSVRDFDAERSTVIYIANASHWAEVVDLPAAAVILAIDALREETVLVGVEAPRAVDPLELERQEKMAEAAGRGYAKGQVKGAAEADRDGWGGKG